MPKKATEAGAALIPDDAPKAVKDRVGRPRVPQFDAACGTLRSWDGRLGTPPHRLVAIGDSLTHGFQSGAVFNTDISWPAIVAHELGWDGFRYPTYPGHGGLPINIEYLLRELEDRYGPELSWFELPRALFTVRQLMDDIEDYWERGPGASTPQLSGYMHALAVYGWDLRDALSRTAEYCESRLSEPSDSLLNQMVENNAERAALRVYPTENEQRKMTLLDVARALGEDHGNDTEAGIETLVVFLGANNALQSVTNLSVKWSGTGYDELGRKNAYTVWRPEHFEAELDQLVAEVKTVNARHVIWCTVPHVTIAPIARGVGSKLPDGSRYYPYYTRPWISDEAFNPADDPHISGAEARAVDYAIDCYNDAITAHVKRARADDQDPRDWYLLDISGLLDRLAARRYIMDPNSRPDWWTRYPLPPQLHALTPELDSRFLAGDGEGGRAMGGLFSLDGVHPTTVGYSLIAQEVINVMRVAGVPFLRRHDGRTRDDPITVDVSRLIRRDSLIHRPPQNLTPGLAMLGWADETIDWVKRALSFHV